MGHSGRYELKYVIEEPRALAIASFLRSYLQPSVHNTAGSVPGHPVISLYLDSPDLFFFHQGFAGHKNRYKMRIRFYDDDWEHPAFLEIKRRVGDVIVKERAMISREGVQRWLLEGWPKQPYVADHKLLKQGKRRADIFQHFAGVCNLIQARGVVFVSYIREIFEAPDDEELRVTLDRQIRGTPYDGSGRLAIPKRGIPPNIRYFPPDGVVLELKFEDRPPAWMHTLVQTFNLERVSVCKYCTLVDAMGLQWGRAHVPAEHEKMIMWALGAGAGV